METVHAHPNAMVIQGRVVLVAELCHPWINSLKPAETSASVNWVIVGSKLIQVTPSCLYLPSHWIWISNHNHILISGLWKCFLWNVAHYGTNMLSHLVLKPDFFLRRIISVPRGFHLSLRPSNLTPVIGLVDAYRQLSLKKTFSTSCVIVVHETTFLRVSTSLFTSPCFNIFKILVW